MTGFGIAVALLGALGVGTIVPDLVKRWWPSRQDKSKSQNDFITTTNTAILIHDQLDKRLDDLVEEKTQSLQNILMRRELEYAVQIKDYSRRIIETQEKVKELQQELNKAVEQSSRYQKEITQYYEAMQHERTMKEKYLNELHEAKDCITSLENRVSELEAINKKS